jgi:DNA-binding transcriptional LysR family regulator
MDTRAINDRRAAAHADDEHGDRLLAFEPRHLAALVAVARTGSFRLAGERLGYVQSAVSRQIATLEHVAGTRLVERARGANEVHMTQAGDLLLTHAEALLARLAAAHEDLARLAAGEIGAVRVGVPQGIGQRLLRSALATHRRRSPQTRVVASEFPTDASLFELVENGALDMGIAGLPLEPGAFSSHSLLRVRWTLALPASWALARAGREVQLADLGGVPLIGRHGERSGPALEPYLREAGYEPNVVFRTDIDATVRSLVAAGVGAALLPTFSIAEHDPAITVRPLDGIPLTQVIGLFWHRERQLAAAAEQFRATTCEVCGRLDRERPAVEAASADSAEAEAASAEEPAA